MLGNARVMAFIATAQPEAALAFYRDTLGLELIEDGQWALVFRTDDRYLRVQKGGSVAASPATVLGWDVDDLDGAMADLAAGGVSFERFDWPGQDDAGVFTFPTGDRVAWFKDPDGNLLSLTQFT